MAAWQGIDAGARSRFQTALHNIRSELWKFLSKEENLASLGLDSLEAPEFLNAAAQNPDSMVKAVIPTPMNSRPIRLNLILSEFMSRKMKWNRPSSRCKRGGERLGRTTSSER